MPLDIGESVNYFIDKFLKAPLVSKIARNPVYTAMTIVFVLMLIILFTFRDADCGDDSLLVMTLRTGFYTFIFTCALLFLHNRVLDLPASTEIAHLFQQPAVPAISPAVTSLAAIPAAVPAMSPIYPL